MPKPEDCTSMAEIRGEIDRLDETLVRLFAERAAYIDRAAEIKAGADLPARIETRVEQVVANVRRHADTYGLPPDLVEKLWRRLIDWSIAREESRLGPDSLRRDGSGEDREQRR
ncbi:MAG: chorismate mutase [Pseudomonadota bacterium]